MRSASDFIFLNHNDGLPQKGGWQTIGNSNLWRYNLHYFDDLTALNCEERIKWHRALISRWIEENIPREGIGWEPYPTSLRIVNWIKYALAGNNMNSDWIRSLAIQSRWLRKRLEWHLLGNHLLTNAKALCFAGCYYKGKEAQEWLKQGRDILIDQLSEQILGDGGHFELSPMYHNIILEDVLDLINLSAAYPNQIPQEVTNQLKDFSNRMFQWREIMEHPDEELAFFNDCARGIAAPSLLLKEYAARLGLENLDSIEKHQVYLEHSGYFRWEQGSAVLIGDVGQIGPDYIPGHGHADTLSFELSIGSQRIFVNSGTSFYEDSPERLRQRGTGAHNSVEVDGENSSEVWKSFRVARRAKPFDLRIKKRGGEWRELECSHDGYKRLKGRNIHCRSWQLEEGRLVVRDNIQGPFIKAAARFYLHPAIKVTGNALILPNGLNIQFAGEGGEFKIVASTWHPEFGKSIPSRCIELHINKPKASVFFEWN